ncbi:hypothetical protein DENSPDRAFT_258116 [Dentipellis sp. KUC8613]|nr:hypothetical protein DENSPDRAFT_258116 [Dentipellis sp. KUC8613]
MPLSTPPRRGAHQLQLQPGGAASLWAYAAPRTARPLRDGVLPACHCAPRAPRPARPRMWAVRPPHPLPAADAHASSDRAQAEFIVPAGGGLLSDWGEGRGGGETKEKEEAQTPAAVAEDETPCIACRP